MKVTLLCASSYKADDRRTIYRPILSADFLGEIRTSSTAKFIAEISADKIGRVTYKSRPIFCRPIKSADKICRFYRSSVIGFTVMKLTHSTTNQDGADSGKITVGFMYSHRSIYRQRISPAADFPSFSTLRAVTNGK